MNMASGEHTRHRIEPQLGLLNAVSISVGTIIATGIFLSPKGVFENVESVGFSFIIWIVCGIIDFFTNLCWVELALALPKFGGEYHYLKEIYGNFPAFVIQWLSFFVRFPASTAVRALTFSQYVLAPIFQQCDIPTTCLNLLSVVIIALCAYINAVSVRLAKRSVNILMATKFLALGVIIITGLVFIFTNREEVVSFNNSFEHINWGNIGLAYYAAIWSYSGGDAIMAMTEEFKNPRRDFPRAIFISNMVVMFLYILANVAYFAVLNQEEMLISNAIAVTFADKTLGVFRWIIPVLVSLSAMPMIGFLAQPRSYYATARDVMFPEVIALISVKNKTPVGSIIMCGILTAAYLFLDIWTIINYVGFVTAFCDCLALSTICTMRWFRPDIHKPFMVPIALPIIAIATSFGAVVLAATSSPIDALVGLALTLTVIPAYLIGVYPRTKLKIVGKASGFFTRFFQKFTFSLPEDKVE